MGAIPNTMRRGGVYHFRRAVPAALRRRFTHAELTCSLRTPEACVARRLSRRLYLRSEELFDAVGAAPMLSDDDVRALVKDFYASILAQEAKTRLMSDVPEDEAGRERRAEYYRQIAERSRADLAGNAFEPVRLIAGSLLVKRYGLDASFDKAASRVRFMTRLRRKVVGSGPCGSGIERRKADFATFARQTTLGA